MRHLTLHYTDLSVPEPPIFRMDSVSFESDSYRQVLSNPDMNLTFQGNYKIVPNVFLACYYNRTFVGGIILHHQPHRHTALHLCLDRVNYKDTIHFFAELAVLYALHLGKIPMTLVPNNLKQMKFWMSHVIGIPAATQMEHREVAGGVETNASVYLLPDDWTPRYVNNVVSTWSP